MEDIDMSLDDIITKKQRTRGRRGRGTNFRGVSRKGRYFSDVSNMTPSSSQRRWKHDLFENDVVIDDDTGSRLSNKLLISNLEYGVSDGDLKELFGDFGPMRKLAVHYDRSGRSCGTAEVTFESIGDAISAMEQYNGVLLDGRPMVIQLLPNQLPFMQQRSIQIESFPSTLGPIRSSSSRLTTGNWRNRLSLRDNVRADNGRLPRRSFRGRNTINASRGSMGGNRRGSNPGGNTRFQQRRNEDFTSSYLDNQLDEYKSLKTVNTAKELKPLQNILQGKSLLLSDSNNNNNNVNNISSTSSTVPISVSGLSSATDTLTMGTIASL